MGSVFPQYLVSSCIALFLTCIVMRYSSILFALVSCVYFMYFAGFQDVCRPWPTIHVYIRYTILIVFIDTSRLYRVPNGASRARAVGLSQAGARQGADADLGYNVIIPGRQTDPPPPAKRDTATFSRELQRLRVTAVRLAPRCAPVHAHHAVVQLEGRAPWMKFRIHLETRRAAETTNVRLRIFMSRSALQHRDPPIELTTAFPTPIQFRQFGAPPRTPN